MDTLTLRSPSRDQADLVLRPGVHAIGRDGGGKPTLVDDAAAALAQFCIDRRGVWLQVRDGVRSLHVNGRPVRRMAMLRPGDAVYFDGIELVLLGPSPRPVPTANGAEVASVEGRMVLRGIGGPHHGRCVPIDQPRMVGRAHGCDICIDEPAFAERHARLEPHADGVMLRDLGSDGGSTVNGHPVRHALLQSGDQVMFDAQHRFVVESPVRAVVQAEASDEPTPIAVPVDDPGRPAVRASARRIPWLLLAALLLAGGLSLLLLYGVR